MGRGKFPYLIDSDIYEVGEAILPCNGHIVFVRAIFGFAN
jgi:hypothetical protein